MNHRCGGNRTYSYLMQSCRQEETARTSVARSRIAFSAASGSTLPVIQRDYAQGREDEHSREVRKHFIVALGTALSRDLADAAPVDLDFVYGRRRVPERPLEPLDGQQRLTT